MTNVPFTHGMGAPKYSNEGSNSPSEPDKPLSNTTNLIAAGVSFVLILGVLVWGYRLLTRNVETLPVVKAINTEMRAQPEDPGGVLAQNQGLSVNEVISSTARTTSNTLALAPDPVDLTGAGAGQEAEAVASEQQSADTAQLPVAEDTSQSALQTPQTQDEPTTDELVARLAAGPSDSFTANPQQDVFAQENTGHFDTFAEEETFFNDGVLIPEGSGVVQSLRPNLRPSWATAGTLRQPEPVSLQEDNRLAASSLYETDAVVSYGNEINPDSLPAGTRLVQLGAFDSADIARNQWNLLLERHQDLFLGKSPVFQEALSGGRTFYRLRVFGFDDLTQARRFCTSMEKRKVDCIAVVTR